MELHPKRIKPGRANRVPGRSRRRETPRKSRPAARAGISPHRDVRLQNHLGKTNTCSLLPSSRKNTGSKSTDSHSLVGQPRDSRRKTPVGKNVPPPTWCYTGICVPAWEHRQAAKVGGGGSPKICLSLLLTCPIPNL